jgi:SAM-dependent methyltransferase
MMDSPGQPRELLEEDLANLRAFNRYLGGHRSVLRGVARVVREQRLAGFSLLDVGTGSGDVPARIADWARRFGVKASIVALEPEPVTARVAATLTNPLVVSRSCEKIGRCPSTGSGRTARYPNFHMRHPFVVRLSNHERIFSQLPLLRRVKEGDFGRSQISVVRGDGYAPPFRGVSFDFVLASQLLHHFSEEKIVTLLRTWSQLARRAIIVSDLIRHPVAYHGIRLLTKVCTRNAMTRTDAPLSVRRAFTMAEWSELCRRADVGRFQISSVFPYRMLAIISPDPNKIEAVGGGRGRPRGLTGLANSNNV